MTEEFNPKREAAGFVEALLEISAEDAKRLPSEASGPDELLLQPRRAFDQAPCGQMRQQVQEMVVSLSDQIDAETSQEANSR